MVSEVSASRGGEGMSEQSSLRHGRQEGETENGCAQTFFFPPFFPPFNSHLMGGTAHIQGQISHLS
jgi:hypothetical protein